VEERYACQGTALRWGLCSVVLALAPAFMLLNIALFTVIKEGQQPSPRRAVSNNTQASQRRETPSIVPKKSEMALGESEAARQEQGKLQEAHWRYPICRARGIRTLQRQPSQSVVHLALSFDDKSSENVSWPN
jgi:hypothetical protein